MAPTVRYHRIEGTLVVMPRICVPVPLRWSDMDSFGHVNNAVFLRILEEARIQAFLGKRGEGDGSLMDTGVLVARHEIDYSAPLKYREEPIMVHMWLTTLGGASFDMQYEVTDGPELEKPKVYARAESTLVMFDLAAQRARRIRDSEIKVLTAWQEEPMLLGKARREARKAKNAQMDPAQP